MLGSISDCEIASSFKIPKLFIFFFREDATAQKYRENSKTSLSDMHRSADLSQFINIQWMLFM